jgi:hypothetical protein
VNPREGLALNQPRGDIQVFENSERSDLKLRIPASICHHAATREFSSIDFAAKFGGERGIRTLEGLLTLTPLAGPVISPGPSMPLWESPYL